MPGDNQKEYECIECGVPLEYEGICHECSDRDYDDDLCPSCNGSGEGQREGSICWECKGRGTLT